MHDCLESFDETIEDYVNNNNLHNYLLELVETLYTDLETERNTTASLQKQILDLTKGDTCGITSKFAALKEDYAALRKKLLLLKNENEDLNIQLIAQSQESKKMLTEKEEQMNFHFKKQLQEKDAEIEEKNKEIERSKSDLEQKKADLYNDIQAVEASSALELEKVESEFRRQLIECNKKLKDSMDTCNILRIELMTVKEQFVEYKRTSNEKIADLQKRLRSASRIECSSDNADDPPISNKSDVSSKTFSYSNEKPINLKKTHRKVLDQTSSSLQYILPPLIEVKETKTAKERRPSNKRRKLYNPEDLSYLNYLSD